MYPLIFLFTCQFAYRRSQNNHNQSGLRDPSEKNDSKVIGLGLGAKTMKIGISGPGVPSHFYVYRSICLQKVSN